MMINYRMLSSLVIVALLTMSGAAHGAGYTSKQPGASLNGARKAPAAPESRRWDTAQGTSPAASSSSGYAFTLLSLRQETAGHLSRVLVESTTPPLYTVMRPNDQLIVIELPGADGSKLLKQYSIESPVIDRISVRNAAASLPATSASVRNSSAAGSVLATRIEIGVKARLKDRSMVDGNTLVLELSAEDGAGSDQSKAPAAAQARLGNKAGEALGSASASGAQDKVAARPLDAKKASAQPSRSDVYVYPESVKAEAQPAGGSPSRQATLLPAVRAEASPAGTRVLVDADGVAQYKDFTLTNPSRIVVDFQGVRSEFGNKTLSVDGGPVERVRVGQPGPNTVRVVIDSKSKLPYIISRQGASLVIAVGDSIALNPANTRTTDARPGVKPYVEYQTPGPASKDTSSPAVPRQDSLATGKTTPTATGRPQTASDSRARDAASATGKTASVPDSRVSGSGA